MKIIQIAVIPSYIDPKDGELVEPQVIGLCDDGSLCAVATNEWYLNASPDVEKI